MPTVAIDARDARGPQLRGWGRYTLELVRALRRRAEGELLELDDGGPGPEIAWEQLMLPRILRHRQADVVHAPNCFLPLRRPCPGVVTVHDLAFEAHADDFSRVTGAKYRWFTPRAIHSAERVICVSRFTADDVCERYGADPEKLRVVPNAPALPIGDAPPPPGPSLLAVGARRGKKTLDRLVAAWRAATLDHRLVIAGAGDRRWPDVEPPGYVDDAQLDALLRGADLLVHPSFYEGFGLVVAEALVRGTPVACARATALPELAGDAAEWFDPFDVDDIAAAVLRALARRDELSLRGPAQVAALSWERTARETAAVYAESVGA